MRYYHIPTEVLDEWILENEEVAKPLHNLLQQYTLEVGSSEKKDVATQIHTVRGVTITPHVLANIRLNTQVKKLLRTVGQLGALVSDLSTALMDLSCFAHGGDEKLGHDVRQGNVDFDTLEKKVQKYAPTLPLDEQDERIEQVRASIKLLGEVGAKSVCSTTPVWRSSLREEKTPPTTFLEQFLIQLSLSKPPSQSSTKEKVMAPFVCRICRKDQRTGMSVPQTAPDKQANAPKKGRNLPAVKPPRKR